MPKLPGADIINLREAQPASGAPIAPAMTGHEEDIGLATARQGATVAGFGNEISRLVEIENERQDSIKVEDAWNKYKNVAVDATAGEKGVLRLKGADAVNGNMLQTVDDQLTTTRQQLIEGLTNNVQKQRFKERTDSTDLQVKHQVLNHFATEQVTYAATVMQGNEAAAKSQVAAIPTDGNLFGEARDTLLRQADAFLDRSGIKDAGARQAYKDKLTDSLWETRIDTLLYSQPTLADAMFRANKDAIHSPELRLQLQAKTKEAALGVIAANEADKLMNDARGQIAQASLKSLEPGSREAQLKAIDATIAKHPERANDPDLREARYVLENMVTAPNTSGLPNSRDVAAQLPVIMSKVEARADELYGPDKGNPDRMAFIKRTTMEVHSKLAADVQQLNAIQRQAAGKLIDFVTGVNPAPVATGMTPAGGRAGTPGQLVTSFSQIQANPDMMRAWQRMDPAAKLGIERLMEINMRHHDEGDYILYRDTWNRIHLPDGDPRKINFYQQIVDPALADRLSVPQIQQLRLELDRNETPGGRSLNQLRKAADTNAALFFKTNIMFTAQPDRQIAATMRWNEEVGKRIDDYVKAGQPDKVRAMFQLDNPESVISPKYLQTYVDSTPAQGLAQQAAQVRAGQPAATPPAAQPTTVDTREKLDAWFKTLPPTTTTFTGTDGKVRLIPRAAAPAAPPPAVIAPASAAAAPVIPAAGQPGQIVLKEGEIMRLPTTAEKMDATGKIVQPPAPTADDIPTLVEGPLPLKGVRTEEQKIAAAARLEDALTAGFRGGLWVVGSYMKLVARNAGDFIQFVKGLNPTEQERAVTGFRALLQHGTFRANEDTVVLLNNFLASKQGTAAENAKAQRMLKVIADRLGIVQAGQ